MKVKLIRAARIRHEAGDIVEVSPAEAGFLFSTGSAIKAEELPEMKRETPEASVMISAEMPEEAPKPTKAKKAEPAETPEQEAKPKSRKAKKE